VRGRHHRLGGNPHVAIGAVLEADRARQARGHLAMDLALGGARADRAPGHQVGDVLRADRVQVFAAGRQAERVDVAQQRTAQVQALVDVEAAVQVRVVDQALPTHRGARLLEVHPHHDLQRVAQGVAQWAQAAGVVHRRDRVVDRARADHHHQAVVVSMQDAVHGAAGARHGVGYLVGAGNLRDQLRGRDQRIDAADAQVVGMGGHLGMLLGVSCVASVSCLMTGDEKAARFAGGFRGGVRRGTSGMRATLPPPVASETNIQNKRRRGACSPVH